MKKLALALLLAGCASPSNQTFAQDTTAQKAVRRSAIIENREPPLIETQPPPQPLGEPRP